MAIKTKRLFMTLDKVTDDYRHRSGEVELDSILHLRLHKQKGEGNKQKLEKETER